MSEPTTQAQAHDRRIGRLEGIAEQITYRLDSLERTVAELRQTIEEQGRQLRQTIEEQGRQTVARMDALRQEHRRDFRWLVGIQLTTLLALGTLILSRLPG